MYKCDKCGKSSMPKTSCKTVVASRRLKTYPERQTPVRNGRALGKIVNRPVVRYEGGDKKLNFPSDPGGSGWEIAVEMKLCNSCYEKAAA